MIMTAVIVDDDSDSCAWLKYTLQKRFPELNVETRLTPELPGSFDLYLLDNDFNGTCLAANLASAIRDRHSNSLIVAFSGRLDAPTLKHLLNAGCDGAFDKSTSDDIEGLLRVIEMFLEQRFRQREAQKPRGLFSAVRSIAELLTEWNMRLDAAPFDTHAGPHYSTATRSQRRSV